MSRNRLRRSGGRAPRPLRSSGDALAVEAEAPVDLSALHRPVLARETLASLAVRPGGRYLDGTLGLGGHTALILDAAAPDGRVLGIDADPDARALAAERLRPYGDRVQIVGGNARDLAAIAQANGFDAVDGLLLDLGVSSLQLGAAGRGFSFQHDAPLDMRMDPSQPLSAATIVNQWPADAIADVLWRYGDERRSRRLAAAIVAARPLKSTTELAALVARVLGQGDHIHPATRTFQALRIAVNDELAALAEALAGALELLRPGGRLSVISFHSGEDRIVKRFMQEQARGCVCPPRLPVCRCGHTPTLRLVNQRVITAGTEELETNPRARSAKLRSAERLAPEASRRSAE